MVQRFFTWLGTQEKDHPVWHVLGDGMRFLVLTLAAGLVLYTGASSFDLGEARTSGVLGLVGLYAVKQLRGVFGSHV